MKSPRTGRGARAIGPISLGLVFVLGSSPLDALGFRAQRTAAQGTPDAATDPIGATPPTPPDPDGHGAGALAPNEAPDAVQTPDQGEPPDNEHEPARRPDRRERTEPRRIRKHTTIANGMVYIPATDFTMGPKTRAAGEPNEQPSHRVKIRPFWIDRTEVTLGEFSACVTRGDCRPPTGRAMACTFGRPNASAELPVNCISWQGADAYCRAIGKRLPSEAEWELAAHGGTSSRYPWGNDAPSCQLATTLVTNRTGASCSPSGPVPVGRHPKGGSPFDVLDMAGNVEEWVADWYADRYIAGSSSETPVESPDGPAFGAAHVLRGGGWMSRPRDARTTARSWGSLNEAGPNVGFRCARD